MNHAAGRLVKLFNHVMPSNVRYYLVCPEGNENHPRVSAFREWLQREAVFSQAAFDRLVQQDGVDSSTAH